MSVLIGYDGSDGAADAVALARLLAPVADGDVSLVYATSPYLPSIVAFEEVDVERVPEAVGLLEAGREALGGEAGTRVFVGASPPHILTEVAEREGAALVVVGSPHRGAVGRALVGSVAERLLHGASCPIVVAPRGFADRPHEPLAVVAVGYDGAPESKLALNRAAQIARTAGARLRVLYVQEPLAVTPAVAAYTPPLAPDPAEIVAEATAAAGPDVRSEGRALAGPAAGALAEACEDGVDLLVVGSRGYGPLGRVLLGSVSTALLHKAPCPVLVVPRAKAKERS